MDKIHFDASNLKKSPLMYILIITVVIIVLYYTSKKQLVEMRGNGKRTPADGNGDIYYKGRGHESDSVSELLDRIEWASYLDKRITRWHRIFQITVIILALVVIFVMRRIPKPGTLVLLIVVIFIPIYACHQMLQTHGDIYNDHYIKTNARLIRKKLDLKKNDPPDPKCNAPDRSKVM